MSARDEQLAREWIEKAERDLLTAETMLTVAPPPTDLVCFHYQQAAEKYLKGFLTWHGMPPSRTHDLGDLLRQCGTFDARLDPLRPLALLLTDYAVEVRYPGLPRSDPSEQEARAAGHAAREIRHAVRIALALAV